MDEEKMQSGGEKSPEEELLALLQQSKGKTGAVGPSSPRVISGRLAPTRFKINWVAVGISALALVLVFGTGYFLLMSSRFNTGELTLELNESQVELEIDEQAKGTVDTGAILRLRTGEHTLVFAKDGFLELERTVTIKKSDQTLLSLQLLPVPTIEKIVEGAVQYARLNRDGSEIVYWDLADHIFKVVKTSDKQSAALFRGSFSEVPDVVWSLTGQRGIVKIPGQPQFNNWKDNRGVRGRYVTLGERPVQGLAKFTGVSTWLFDDDLKTAAGWQPVRLNDSIRQVAFSMDGAEILYVYDTADGEYSLVRALVDGEEWERVIVDFPRLSDNAKIMWSADDRHMLIENEGKLLITDLVAKSVSEIVSDRIAGSTYGLSSDGETLAYLADVNGTVKLKTYALMTGEIKEVDKAEVSKDTVFVWLDSEDILLVSPNQMFIRVSTVDGGKMTIPFTGQEVNFQVQKMGYSLSGQTLMLIADTGIFVMRL